MSSEFALTENNVLGLICDNSPDLITLVDVNGLILYSNAAHLVRLGRPPDALLGTLIFELIHPDDADAFSTAIANSAKRRGVLKLSARWVRDSGRLATMESLGKWVSADRGRSQYLLLCSRENNDTAGATQAATAQLRHDALLLLNDAEGKRNEVARAIHDELGQKLTAMNIELALWKSDVDAGQSRSVSTIREKIAAFTDLVSSMISCTRKITATLRPRILEEFGLVAAVEWHLEKLHQRTGVSCTVSAQPEKLQLDSATAAHAFRLIADVTSSLNAGSASVTVRLRKTSERFFARIDSDVAPPEPAPDLRARLDVLGGQIETDEQGTSIILPLNPT